MHTPRSLPRSQPTRHERLFALIRQQDKWCARIGDDAENQPEPLDGPAHLPRSLEQRLLDAATASLGLPPPDRRLATSLRDR